MYCSVEMNKKDVALAIFNGFKILCVKTLKWKFVEPFVTKVRFNELENSEFPTESSIYSDHKCVQLVQYLLQRQEIEDRRLASDDLTTTLDVSLIIG